MTAAALFGKRVVLCARDGTEERKRLPRGVGKKLSSQAALPGIRKVSPFGGVAKEVSYGPKPQPSPPELVLDALGEKWEAVASEQKLLVGLSLAFVIANMDKVNLSLAIIPMAEEFGWGPSVAGLVQSSFFWGLLLSQIPGGVLCSRFGGRQVLPKGLGLWSIATLGLPLWATTIPGICVSRAAVGLGEAAAPSAVTDIVGRTVPKEERSRAISFVFSGLHVGSIAGLLFLPFFMDHFGWRSVFMSLGAVGMFWVFWFEDILKSIEDSDPELYSKMCPSPAVGDSGVQEGLPWRAIIRHQPVQALAFAHFCTNWFGYSMMAWLPSYITHTLKMDISHAAQVSLLPPVAGIICGILSGQLADSLVSTGMETGKVRKLVQGAAFLGPAACLLAGAFCHDGKTEVGLVTVAIGLASFCMGGLYSNHQDLSTKYSSFLLGLTNTIAAVPGILGVLLTGYLYESTGDWHMSLFAPATVMMLLGTIVYTLYGSSDPAAFDDNKPFALEKWLDDHRLW